MADNTSIWDSPPAIQLTANEATVEVQLIAPLLAALGYDDADISAKHPVRFQQGRAGRPAEADFAIFDGANRDLGNCLFVVEAKRPNETFDTAQMQAESYAMYLRALVYIVTNGISLEIWQFRMTTRSELVLKCNVSDLRAHRAEIETVVNRANLRTYREKIREPLICDVSVDVSAYENAELERLAQHAGAVARTLSEAESPSLDQPVYNSDDILDMSTHGGVIYARSGMGKTFICNRLYQLSLSRRQLISGQRLSVQIFLPDLTRPRQSIVEFAFRRISAHCPSVSESIFKEMLLKQGLDFFFDAFDRISVSLRQEVETDLNLLLRDSPRSRLFIFSRSTSSPQLVLPSFHLQPLNFEEQRQLQESITDRKNSRLGSWKMPDIAGMLPPFLARIASSPLIFAKIVDFYIENHNLPTRLVDLFEFWLDEALRQREHSLTAYDRLVRALTVVATVTWSGPSTVSDVVEVFDNEQLPHDTLDTLAQIGAVIRSNRNVEVEHEALADFLRARATLASLADTEPLTTSQLDRESFFPVLLLAMATDRDIQQSLLMQLTPIGLAGYIDAVRYRGIVIPNLSGFNHDQVETGVLADIVDGFTAPAQMFFPTLLPAIVEAETGVRSIKVTAQGKVESDLKSIEFSLFAITEQVTYQNLYYRGKKHRDIARHGRNIGMEILHGALSSVISEASLTGGVVWHEERLLSRLRLLLHEGFDIEPSLEVAAQRTFWEPFQGECIHISTGFKSYIVLIDEVLTDLDVLSQSGKKHLAVWWNPNSNAEWWLRDWDLSDEAIRQFYLRTDVAYGEVVHAHFSQVAPELNNFQVMPRAWDIVVTPNGRFGSGLTFTSWWHPVPSQSEVNAVVRRDNGDRLSRVDTNRWFEETTAQLSALGRRFTSISYSRSTAPSFNGHAPTGPFDGKTAVLRAVCSRLGREFDTLFNRI